MITEPSPGHLNGKIQFAKHSSIDAVQNFDYALGGGKLYSYSVNIKGKTKTRLGSQFVNNIKHSLYLKTR